ncbi:hypothetical protein B0H19DRAFT_1256062 [Mycena capillaripes]|nr:hypothetical protein B0H19DRAFT_1256062 [Mycena capillaripes]
MASLEEILQVFTIQRYFSAVAFIAVIFDHIITIGHEVNAIWTNPNVHWQSKAAFFANRYPPEAILAMVRDEYYLEDNLAGTTSHFVIIMRIYRLWDRRRNVARILTTSFTVCISVIIILAELTYFEPLQTCRFGTKPKVVTAMLGVLSFFDFSLVLLIVFNAMDRPRLTDVKIVSELQRDGLGFFLTIFVLRFVDTIVSIFQDTTPVFLAMTTVWGFCTIVNARLHMRLEGLVLARSQGALIMMEDM